MLPFGFLHLLGARRRAQSVRVLTMGVVREHRRRGIDMLLVVGPYSTAALCCIDGLPKPVFAPLGIDADALGLPTDADSSGVHNLSYLSNPGASFRDIEAFREIDLEDPRAAFEACMDCHAEEVSAEHPEARDPMVGLGEYAKKGSMISIGPLWDGNEVWLVTGGGALFAAFPEVYATAFSGF